MAHSWLCQVFLGWSALPVFSLSPTDLEMGKECGLHIVSSFCTFSILSLPLFPKAWQFVKNFVFSLHTDGRRGWVDACFSSSDKSYYLQIKLHVCTALFKLSFLHIWTKEKNWRTSSCHDKHCIGAKMTAPHPYQNMGLTPLFWPLPFLSQDILSCIANLGQPVLGLGRWLEFLLGCSCHQSRHDIGAVQWQISHTLNS